jgi:hypothetical protein
MPHREARQERSMNQAVTTIILLAIFAGVILIGRWVLHTRLAGGEASSNADKHAGGGVPGADFIDSEAALRAREIIRKH